MMIGKTVRYKGNSQTSQLLKKTLWVANAGDRMNWLLMKSSKRFCFFFFVNGVKIFAFETKNKGLRARKSGQVMFRFIHDNKIHFLQARGKFTQRTGWQETAIAKITAAVDHGQFHCSR